MKGMIRLYGAFRRHLRHQRKKVAALQLLGRLEEYFTKEFASVILLRSGNSVLPLTNLGRRTENRIDIALVEGDFSRGQFGDKSFRKNSKIRGFIEVKYFRNMSRIGPGQKNDETMETLKDLRRQLKYFCRDEHGGYRVKLRSRRSQIYGLVIASYARDAAEEDKSKEFAEGIIQKASRMQFCYEDLPKPYIKAVYKDVPVTVLRRKYRASLYTGLWRLA